MAEGGVGGGRWPSGLATTRHAARLGLVFLLFLSHCLHVAQAARSIRRLCKNEIDILSDEGVHIEPVDQSRVELELAVDKKLRARNVIRFEFRTTREDGIVFYGRRRHDGDAFWELLALKLNKGFLFYKIQCPTVHADVLISHKHRLNDGHWHSVVIRYRRGGAKTQIEVDGERDTKTYEVSCGQMTSLVFGGASPQDAGVIAGSIGPVGHFEGCIRNVNIPHALRLPPKYYAISICEN